MNVVEENNGGSAIMRWFKHMTATKDDERIVELLAVGGLEAYGFYWAVIELIARQMEKESNKCSVTYPLPYLSRQLYCHHNKVTNLLGKLQVTGLMDVSKVEVNGRVNFKITCSNLLKYRDEYSRRKEKTTDNIPTKSREAPEQETDTDTETETDIDIETDIKQKQKKKKAKKLDVALGTSENQKNEISMPEVEPPTISAADGKIGDMSDIAKWCDALAVLQLSQEDMSIITKLKEKHCKPIDAQSARLDMGKYWGKLRNNSVQQKILIFKDMRRDKEGITPEGKEKWKEQLKAEGIYI